jgi:hypothetical protein
MSLKPERRARVLAIALLSCFPLLVGARLEPSASPADSSPVLAAQTAPQAEAGEDARTRRKQRLLRTTSGEVLRGTTRWREDHWEISMGGRWVELPPGSVVSARDEDEVRAEARHLSRQVGRSEHQRRVALATWMAEQGLETEALSELDVVLSDEPDQPAALHLLRSADFARPRVGDPRDHPEQFAQRLQSALLTAPPAKSELCILELGRLLELEGGRDLLEAQLASELLSTRVLRRANAARVLRRLLPGSQVRELLRRCALDTSRPVRESAALALRATEEPGIITPLVRALGSESRAVRTNAAESLGLVGFELAVPALVTHFANLPQGSGSGGATAPSTANLYVGLQFAYVGDFDVELAQGASIADPTVTVGDSGVVLDARIGGISGYTYATEFRTVRSALQRLVGENPGSSPADWERWYAQHRARFVDARHTSSGGE